MELDRNYCKNIKAFCDNKDGSFTIKGKGIKISNRVKIPNTVFVGAELAYVFGLFVAEGYLIDDNNIGSGVFFSLSPKEKDIAINIIDIIQRKFGINGSYKIQNGRCVVRFSNKALTKIFREIDFGLNCYTKKVPDIIFKCSDTLILKNFVSVNK